MKLSVAAVTLLVFMLQRGAMGDKHSRKQLMKSIATDLTALQLSVWRFWACHGLDHEQGGFHGTLTRSGAATQPTSKGLVQQTRHTWAFSTFYQHGYNSMPFYSGLDVSHQLGIDHQRQAMHQLSGPAGQAASSIAGDQLSTWATAAQLGVKDADALRQEHVFVNLSSSQMLAASAYAFTTKYLRDPADGMFYWMVSRDGNTVLQANKVLYGQWFVMYGLSAFYNAFNKETAREWALQCFTAMDAAWHNSSTGGYNEGPDNRIPPDTAPGSDAEEPRVPTRTLNSLMHGLEALTALHRISKDPLVLARTLELLDILCSRLQQVQGLIFEGYEPGRTSDQTWQPAPGQMVNYGHNLECAWLVADTLEYLLSIQAISPALAGRYLQSAMSIGAAAVRHGFDNIHGGVFEYGSPETGPNSWVKVWWIQAEAMLALWKLYKYYDDTHYLRQLASTTHFVARFVNDGRFGEQFWQVEADGKYTLDSDPVGGNKGNQWKASYHSSRATLFLQQWMKRYTMAAN